ncbi:hypothetical protein GSI_03271 [Ganoderma sinense ZZ0214-1]|uniref:Uncharacterized protein n=1 Tax=Ganoderma sinense ZZ0214-1 TaxID=1077348 RepID=A0A2G8SL53_9APHY|nr:hypothetical protein GSI_03271 [Ganoderma sinense ZZ0214-1]
MPLTVSIRDFTHDTEMALSICLHHSRRIRRLHAEGPLGLLLAPLTGTFNILEEARLEYHSDEGSSVRHILHFRGDDFPRLHTLEIASADVAWDAFSLQSLRELKLNGRVRGLSTTSLLRILQGSPSLRVLRVGRGVQLLPASEGRAEAREAIPLAHLRQIHLYGAPQELAYVLDRFTVPYGNFHIYLAYVCDDGWWWREDGHSLDMLLPRQLAFRSLLPYCTSLILVIALSGTRVLAFNQSKACYLSIKTMNDLLFANGRYPTMTEEIWMSILDAFSCSPLSRFCLDYSHPLNITVPMWTSLCCRFPLYTVQTKLRGSMEDRGRADLLQNLFTALRDPDSHRVHTLELVSLSLNSGTVGAILDLLKDRASMGAPLERLVFILCYCENSLDRGALKQRFENAADLVIRYDEDADSPDTDSKDEFRYTP